MKSVCFQAEDPFDYGLYSGIYVPRVKEQLKTLRDPDVMVIPYKKVTVYSNWGQWTLITSESGFTRTELAVDLARRLSGKKLYILQLNPTGQSCTYTLITSS